MVGRKLKQAQYGELQTMLLREGQQRPLCPIRELELWVDGVRYTLFLQMERHNQVYLLYALREAQGALITDNLVLSALLELVIYQGITAAGAFAGRLQSSPEGHSAR